MPYPHSRSETIADGIVHSAGLAFALPGTGILLMLPGHDGLTLTAAAVYGASMIAAFSASAVYHLSPAERTRSLLNRIDHAAIYFKIAGTYTPLVVLIGSGFAYGILGLVWTLALGGAVAKLRGWSTQARASLPLYLAMGWLSVLLIRPLWMRLPGTAMALIVAGGLIYSLGTIIYARTHLPYQNAIWHCFVLVASICFFAAIALSI